MELELQAHTDDGEAVALPWVASDIDAYREWRFQLPGVSAQLQARIDALIDADEEATRLRSLAANLTAQVDAFEAKAGRLWSPTDRARLGKVSLSLANLSITWPRPAERWEYGVKAADLAQTDPALASQLGVTCRTDKPRAPIIVLR